MTQDHARRGPERPRLLNPYAVVGETRGLRSSSVAVGAAVFGAAGLVVLGGGVASADDGDGGGTDGFLSSASLEPADASFGSVDPVQGIDGGVSPWPVEATVPVFSPAGEQALTEAAISDDLLQPPDGVESSVGTSTPADVVRIASAPSVEDAAEPADMVDADQLDTWPTKGEDGAPAGVVPYSTTAGSSAGLPSGTSGEDDSTTRASALSGAAEAVTAMSSDDGSVRSVAGRAADPVQGAAARPAVPGEPAPTDDGPRTGGREALLGAATTEVVSDTPMDLGISSEPGREVLVASLPARPLGGEPVDPESIFDPAQRRIIDFAQGPGANFLDLVLNTEYQNTSEVGEALRRFVTTYPEYLECPVQVSCVTTSAPDGTTTIVPGTVTIGRNELNPFGVRDLRNRVPADAAGVGTVTVNPPVFDTVDNDSANFPEVGTSDFSRLSQLAHLFPHVPAVTGTTVNGFTGDTLEFEVPRFEHELGSFSGAPDRYELSNPLGLPVADRIRILNRTYDTESPLTNEFRIDLRPGTRVDPPGTAWNAYRPTATLNADAADALLQAQRDAAAELALADLELLEPTAPEETIQQALDHVTRGWSVFDDFTPSWRMAFPDPWDAEDSEQQPGQPPFPSQALAPLLPGTQIRGLLPAARDVGDRATSVDPAGPGADQEVPESADAGSVGSGGQVVAPESPPQLPGLEPGPGSRSSEGVPMPPPGLAPPRAERWEIPPLEELLVPAMRNHTGHDRGGDDLEVPVTRFPLPQEGDRLPSSPVGRAPGEGSQGSAAVPGVGSAGTGSVPAASPVLTCDGGAWVVCAGSPGHPAGQPRVGSAILGPAIVGPKFVGPAIVGPKFVGPKIVGSAMVGPAGGYEPDGAGSVGPGLVGPGLVGPGTVGPEIVGVGIAGPKFVGSGIVGPGIVGPKPSVVPGWVPAAAAGAVAFAGGVGSAIGGAVEAWQALNPSY